MSEEDRTAADVGARRASPASADDAAAVKEEDVYEVLREVYDPEIPVNIVDLGLIYEVDIKPQRVDVKMTLTALGCPMAGEVMQDVRDHLLQISGVEEAGVELVYEPPWSPERMSEDARWELGIA
jgi:FeS assembly SUF system protein